MSYNEAQADHIKMLKRENLRLRRKTQDLEDELLELQNGLHTHLIDAYIAAHKGDTDDVIDALEIIYYKFELHPPVAGLPTTKDEAMK